MERMLVLWCMVSINVIEVYGGLVDYIDGKYINPKKQIDEFVNEPQLMSLCKYHFNNTIIVSVIIEKSYEPNWNYFTNEYCDQL